MEHLQAQIALILTRSEYKTARALIGEANRLSASSHLLPETYIRNVRTNAWTRFNEARRELKYAVKYAERLCGIRRTK